jgi:hypothetical protein
MRVYSSVADGSEEHKRAPNIIILHPSQTPSPNRNASPGGETMALIRRLRLLLQRSLLQPRDDLDHACMLIAAEPQAAVGRYGAALFHGLENFARRQLRFYAGKAIAASEDEMWLARLIEALQTGDRVNARYLLALRVEPQGRRRLLFLAQGLADGLLAERQGTGKPVRS